MFHHFFNNNVEFVCTVTDLPTFELGSQKKGAKDQDQDAKVKETKALVDEAFLLFQARIARAPDQILR